MTNYHISFTDFSNESRVLKETEALIQSGLINEIGIISFGKKNALAIEQIDKNRVLYRILLPNIINKKGFIFLILKIIYSTFWILFFFKKRKVDIINCHSIKNLHIGVLLKKKYHLKLIYDAHELESEQAGFAKKSIAGIQLSDILRNIEARLIKHVDGMVVVSESIQTWYQENMKVNNIVTIRNIPKKNNTANTLTTSLRKEFNIPIDTIVYAYSGLIDKVRGIDILLEVFKKVDLKHHIIFMGYGDAILSVQEAAQFYSNIHYKSAVEPHLVTSYLQTADVGLFVCDNICLSYYYCLPNKMFEYILSGLALIVSDFPDMSKIIHKYNCGYTTKPSVEYLAELIKDLKLSDINKCKQGSSQASLNMNWESESLKLTPFYERILSGTT